MGTTVTKGQEIGTMGTTGSSTGIHLHFQIATSPTGFHTEDGTIDPEIYLDMDFGGGTGPETPENAYFITNRHSTNMRRMGTRGRR